MSGECRSGRSAGPVRVLVLTGVASLMLLSLTACTDLTTPGTGSTDSTLESGTTEVTTVTEGTGTTVSSETTEASGTTLAPTTTEVAATTTSVAALAVSKASRDYARSLGGTSHKGDKLYFVIGASVKTEKQARILLEPAKAVGDMQSYFIVQLSDNFAGMTPGYWVVFEAYRNYPSAENLEFCRRPFPHAYVKRATVLTSDPIPVYEDLVPGA